MSAELEVHDEVVGTDKIAPRIVMMSPQDIAPSPFGSDVNPPATPEEERSLRESIARDGVQVPITAGRIDGKGGYVVVKGTRRHRHASELHLPGIPVEKKEYASEWEMRLDALNDNLMRRQFTPAQRAEQANHVWRQYESAEDKKEMAAKGLSPRKRAAIDGGISEGSLASFRYVLDSGNAELIAKMRTGELSIDRACREAKKLTDGNAPIVTTTKAEAKTAAAEQMKSLRASFEDLVRAAGILRDTVKRGKKVVKQAKKEGLNDPALLIKQIQAVNQAVAALAIDSAFAEPCDSTSSAPAEDAAASDAAAGGVSDLQEEDTHA